jgi:hypothetical protein
MKSEAVSWVPSLVLAVIGLVTGLQTAPGANVMNYGADGNDYFQF